MLKTAIHRYFSALLLLLLTAGAIGQQNGRSPVTTAADAFVQDILLRAGSPSALTLSFQNMAQLPAETMEAAQNAIYSSFRSAGVRLVKPELAMADVQITFSEDWQSYVWIAAIQQGPGKQMVMKRLPRSERTALPRAPTLTLRKYVVWQQDTPILDFFTDTQNLVVLEPDQVSLYSNDSNRWRQRATLAIPHAQPWPRDLRGRLQVNGSQVNVFLPGTRCTWSLSSPSIDCRASDDPWQIDQGPLVAFFSSRRNFFNGILSGPSAGATVLPFFSAAAWPSGDQQQWMFAGTDGRARLYQNDLSAPVAVFNAWGSNLAALHSNCGSGWQLIVSAPTDNVHPDILQAIEIAGRDAQTVSTAVDMPGTVSALWTSGKNGDAVNVVMQSPVTGKYEALILTVSCN
jgi:hypothetical protein